MKKVLFVATVDSHIRHFHIPYLKYFKDNNYEVHVATSNDENEKFDYCDKKHTITFERSPFKINNLKAIKQMKKLLSEEDFDIVHCHTPMGGVVTRIAAKSVKKKNKKNSTEGNTKKDTKIFYTAHGFHFYKGAPLINWLIYYPVEKWLSKYTDVLITINNEDYEYAKKFKAKRVEKIDGIGVDDKRFNIEISDAEKDNLRKEFGISKDDTVITYVAELIPRKNQSFLIDAMKDIVTKNKNVKLLLVGTGALKEQYENQIKSLNLNDNVILTGYRKDVPKIFRITDIGVSTSKQEGLPINLVEAMLSEVPVVASNVRGNNEIVENDINGYLYKSREELIEKLELLINDKATRDRLKKNTKKTVQKFTLENSLKEGIAIYESELK